MVPDAQESTLLRLAERQAGREEELQAARQKVAELEHELGDLQREVQLREEQEAALKEVCSRVAPPIWNVTLLALLHHAQCRSCSSKRGDLQCSVPLQQEQEAALKELCLEAWIFKIARHRSCTLFHCFLQGFDKNSLLKFFLHVAHVMCRRCARWRGRGPGRT
jgi:hypothetical protein